MSPARFLASSLVCLLPGVSLAAPEGHYALAVLELTNTSAEPGLDPMGAAMSNLITAELTALGDEIVILERERLKDILNETRLTQLGVVDTETAREVGGMLGADGLLTGTILRVGRRLVVTVRVVNVDTGVAHAFSAEGSSVEDVEWMAEVLARRVYTHVTGVALEPPVAQRDPWLAGVVSLMPGGGQYYNEEYVQGGVLTAAGVASIGAAIALSVAYPKAYDRYLASRAGASKRDDLFQRARNIRIGQQAAIGVSLVVIAFAAYDAVLDTMSFNQQLEQRYGQPTASPQIGLAVLPSPRGSRVQLGLGW